MVSGITHTRLPQILCPLEGAFNFDSDIFAVMTCGPTGPTAIACLKSQQLIQLRDTFVAIMNLFESNAEISVVEQY